jgi:hypothetical protein
MKPFVHLRQALADPALLGDALPGESWSSSRALLIAAVGEELTAAERETFKELTGREREPGEMVCVAGRRSGKSRAMSVLSVCTLAKSRSVASSTSDASADQFWCLSRQNAIKDAKRKTKEGPS